MTGPLAREPLELGRERAGQVVVAKVDTDRLSDVAARFAIRSIPTLVLFRGGRESARVSGAMRAAEIARRVGLG